MPPKAKNKKEVDVATPEIDLDAEEWIQNATADKKNGLQVTYGGAEGTYQLDDWVPNDGLQHGGTVDSVDIQGTYNVGQLDFDFEDAKLRKKYPALNDAWEHYQNVKQMCETREKEEDAN